MKDNLRAIFLLIYFYSSSLAAQNFQWAKNTGGTSSNFGRSVAIDVWGNIYTTGYFSGTSDFDPGAGTFTLTSAGDCDIFISKLNSSGNFMWAKNLGGTGSDQAHSIVVDALGNVYATGWFQGKVDFDPGSGIFNITSNNGLSYDVFILKIDSSGNFIWVKNMGGPSADLARSIALDAVGNVYTTGYFMGVADFDPGAGIYNLISAGVEDIFISKLDNGGNFIWAKNMGGTLVDEAYSISVDLFNHVYITGEFKGIADFDPGAGSYNLTSAGNSDIFATKLNASGDLVWVKSFGGTLADQVGSMVMDVSGNLYITGYFSGTLDFDPGAGVFNLTSAGSWDIFINKLDGSGNFLWAKRMGGTLNDSGRSIVLDALGNIYTTGYFTGTADFDPGPGTFNMATAGGNDIFVSKLNTSGNFVWAKQMGGTLNCMGLCIAVNGGNICTTGHFTGAIDFDPGPGNYSINSIGSFDIFVSKLSCIAPTVSSASSNSLICRGQAATLTANGANSYFWSNGVSGTVVVVIPPITTSYTLTGVDSGGCANISVLTVSVDLCTGVEQFVMEDVGLKIFPNPAGDILQIQLNSFEEERSETVFIYNNTGQLIREEKIIFHNKVAKIKTEDLPDGVYVLKLLLQAVHPVLIPAEQSRSVQGKSGSDISQTAHKLFVISK